MQDALDLDTAEWVLQAQENVAKPVDFDDNIP